MGRFGVGEIVFILAVLLLLFGAKRLPDIAGGLGKGIREFKRTMNEPDEIKPAPPQQPQQQLPRTPEDASRNEG